MHQNVKKNAVRRLRRAAGQVKGLEKMVEEGIYCVKILHQSLAVKAALSAFEDVILENHLKTHAATQMKKGKSDLAARELATIYKLSRRR
ncbi:MAG: metal-sensitive transcriptional regulator [Candidatus Jorgensenbacteria bacterium]|nr:metal-sensitive transcriptional regulator [Candidatus Jorgensenbacteria bacterium]